MRHSARIRIPDEILEIEQALPVSIAVSQNEYPTWLMVGHGGDVTVRGQSRP
jgi:hypothetical protein